MKSKNFKDLVKDYRILRIISEKSLQSLNSAYDNGDDELKEKLDEYPQVFLDDYLDKAKKDSSLYKAVSSIQSNIQFLTWLTIISLVIYLITILAL